MAFRPYAWFWVLCALAVALLAWRTYRSTTPPLSDAWRRTLLALRMATLVLCMLLAAGPRLDWSGLGPRKPRVSVLVDQSRSLAFADGSGSRSEAVARVLDGPGMSRVESESEIAWQGFAGNTWALDRGALTFSGDASAIGDALLEQRRMVPPPDAVVLLTDGASNTGADPLGTAADIGLPIHIVGVGDPMPQADLRVVGVSAPEVALAGQPMTVSTTVENIGIGRGRLPARTALRIVSRGRTLAKKSVALPPPGKRSDYELTVSPDAPGDLTAIVSVDSVPGEILARNNSRPFSSRVLKGKQRVLIVAGAPSADVAYWMRLFRARDNVDVRLWLAPHRSRQNTVASDADAFRTDSLAQIDLVLWHDVRPGAVDGQSLTNLMSAVSAGAGMLVVPGKHAPPAEWASIMPVEASRQRWVAMRTRSQWTAQAPRHPIVSNDPEYVMWSETWDKLPPLLGRTVGISPAKSAVVLLTDDAGPLAVAGNADRGRVLVFGGTTYWRWDAVLRGLGDDESPGKHFWSAAVRWLSTRQEMERVTVQTDSKVYRLGEPVRIVAQVHDANFAPLDDAGVRIEIDDGAIGIEADPQGHGRYDARIAGLDPGDHRVFARARLGSTDLGGAATEFSVTVVGLEHAETRQLQGLLEAAAAASGGSYVEAAAADSMLLGISLEPVLEEYRRSIALGSSGWVLWTIILLLTSEWVIRRVRGLL